MTTTIELRPCDGLVQVITTDDGDGRFNWWSTERYLGALPSWLPLKARLGFRWLEQHGAPTPQQEACINAAAAVWETITS